MTIVAHISLSGVINNLQENFNYRCFTILAERHPEHQFIFLFDRPIPRDTINATNIRYIHAAPSISNNLLLYYWYQLRLPALLKRLNADFFAGNGPVCSTGINIRQCIEINDLSFLDKKSRYTSAEAGYLKKRLAKWVSKAAVVAVASRQMAKAVKTVCPDAAEKIQLTGRGLPDIPMSVNESDKIQFKTEHTGGKEFFLAFISESGKENATTIVKAFSIFKKRQLSGMKLVLLVSGTYNSEIVPDFKNYKYRDDVILLKQENNKHVHKCIAAAYAAMFFPGMFSKDENILLPLVYHVPLITDHNNLHAGIYAEHALYCQPLPEQIAEKMMLIYKDEDLRNRLVGASRQLASSCTWENTATNLWVSITGSASQTA